MSPKTERRSRQGLASRQRILDATFEIAHELGYAGTSIGKVSKRSGLPASSVYWHFANKDELFAEVIQHSFDEWRATMPRWQPPSDGESRRAAVGEQVRHMIASISDSPEFWRLGMMLALERQAVEPSARRRFIEIRSQVIDNLADFFATVLNEDHRPGLPRLMARFTMATADGIFIAARAEGDDDLPALAGLLADSLEALAGQPGP